MAVGKRPSPSAAPPFSQEQDLDTEVKEDLDQEGWWRVLLHNDEVPRLCGVSHTCNTVLLGCFQPEPTLAVPAKASDVIPTLSAISFSLAPALAPIALAVAGVLQGRL